MDNDSFWDDEEFNVPMFIQEPYDPNKIPMYDKAKVYDNGVEYSLEEIRARRYITKLIPAAVEGNLETAYTLSPSKKNLACGPVEKERVIPVYLSENEKLPNGKFEILCDDKNKESMVIKEEEHILETRNIPNNKIISKISDVPINGSCKKKDSQFDDKENICNEEIISGSGGKEVKLRKSNILIIPQNIKNVENKDKDLFPVYESTLAPSFDLDVTSYTKLFNFPVSSSTPFIGKRKVTQNENGRDSVTLHKAPLQNVDNFEAAVGEKELSVIEESSKECVSASNGVGNDNPSAIEKKCQPNSIIKESLIVNRNLNSSRMPTIVAGGYPENKGQQITRIPCPVTKVQPKGLTVGNVSKNIGEIVTDRIVNKENLGEELCEKFEKLVLADDPFDSDRISLFLKSLEVPVSKRQGFCMISRRTPNFKTNADIQLVQNEGDGGHKFKIFKVIGQGAYAKVYKASSYKLLKTVALKVQKPACEWEFYISKEINERVKDYKMKSCFMDVEEAVFFTDGSVLVSDYMEYGTLLDVINAYKLKRIKLPEVLALYFTLDILKIINCLHSCNIIHGDIKPDNFLLRKIPILKPNQSKYDDTSLQLIDLGRCIDMTLYPKNACFSACFQKSYFQCIEMRTKRPWTYQVDLYGIASIIHCLVFGDFMDVYCKDGVWNVSKKVPRNMNQTLWNWLFNILLNVESCCNLPNLNDIIEIIETRFFSPQLNDFCQAVTSLKKILMK